MAGPPAAVARTRSAVREALSSLAPQVNRVVLAAVSGGADSLALASALAFETARTGVRAGAVVIDHQLQEESATVAARAGQQCQALGLDPVDVIAIDVRQRGDGPEAAARTARYAALDAARARHGATHVLLGHTRDDQAEQVLLGLVRGSGARSLAGMAPVAGPLLRPFLHLGRDDTEAACRAAGLTPWRDPHNEDERFARVRARSLLAELSGSLGEHVPANLARTAALLREDDDALTGWAVAASQAATHLDGAIHIEVAALATLPRAVRTRVLRLLLLEAGATGSALAAVHLAEVDRLITDWHGQGPVDVPGHRYVARSRDTLAVSARRPVEWSGRDDATDQQE